MGEEEGRDDVREKRVMLIYGYDTQKAFSIGGFSNPDSKIDLHCSLVKVIMSGFFENTTPLCTVIVAMFGHQHVGERLKIIETLQVLTAYALS